MNLLKIINHYRRKTPNKKTSRRTIRIIRSIIRKRQRTHKRRNSRQHTYNMAVYSLLWNKYNRNIRGSRKKE